MMEEEKKLKENEEKWKWKKIKEEDEKMRGKENPSMMSSLGEAYTSNMNPHHLPPSPVDDVMIRGIVHIRGNIMEDNEQKIKEKWKEKIYKNNWKIVEGIWGKIKEN